MKINKTFWEGKKVFITGHTGFKGGWLSIWLKSMGAEVFGYSLAPNTKPNLFQETNLQTHINGSLADIRDYDKLVKAINEFKPEIILHLAAQPLVRYSYKEPIETYETNVMGTVNVLEAVRQYGKAKVTLIITTDKCYQNKEQIWGYRECDRMGGHDPYSNSKSCAELITRSYALSYYLPSNGNLGNVASVRAGNVIGGGDWSVDRLVPDIIISLSVKKNPIIRSPNSTRPWQHVLEPLSGYITAVEYLYNHKQDKPEAWNFGPKTESEKKVGIVADLICKNWGGDVKLEIEEDANTLHEANLLALDCTKARIELNWKPIWNLETAIKKTVEWYKNYYNGKNMFDFTLKQINEYQSN